jgi:hypothetical protein
VQAVKPVVQTPTDTIRQSEAARLLDVPPVTVARLAAAGLLTERRLPRARPRYLKAEVLALAAKYTRPATQQLVGA